MQGKLLFGAALAAIAFGASAARAQETDPPGDATTTAHLQAGQDVIGAINSGGEADWYRLNVQQGQRYRIALDAAPGEAEAPLDPVVTIYNAGGEQLAVNDDANGSLNSLLLYTPAASGEVFVEARAFNPEATGGYRLHVEESVAPPDDAGNDASSGASVAPGQAVNGELESQGDADWYRLNARQGQIYHISLAGNTDSSAPLPDPLLRIVSADGEELAINDDHENLNAYLDFVPTRSGAVFVVASGFADAQVGDYTLSVEEERLPPDEASADTRTRGRLQVGGTAQGSLNYAGDRDWYRVRLEGGQTYRFALTHDGETPLSDPLLRIHDSHGDELASDDDGGGELNALLEFTPAATGNYYVEAAGYTDQITGGYALRALAGDIPADASTDISLNATGDYRDGVLAPAGDRDWYRIDLTSGQALRISLSTAQSADGLGDPYIVLHGPDGAEVARDDDGGDGLNAWLEYSAAVEGPHYLEVRGFGDDAAGRYQIAIMGGEIGDSPDGAEAIMPGGEPRTSVIGADGDVDWFAIELIEGRPYRFSVQGGDPAPLADPYLVLYNAEGEQVAADDDGGTGLNAYLSYASPTGGPHFVAVSGFGGVGTGNYAVSVTDTEVPGHIYTDENLDATGDDRLSTIEMPGDLDTYRVQLEAGATYRIEVKGAGAYPMADPYLTVLNEAGERITADDDAGPGLDARLSFRPETAGTYHIQASGNGGSTGTYQVSIARP
jgi:hypothetical protein